MDMSSRKESPGISTGTDSAKQGSSSLEEVFQYFAKFGETHSDGQTITLKNIDKWLQQANLMGGKSKIIGADTAITFAKVAKLNKRINLDEFKEFIENLARDKKMDSKSMLDQLVAAGQPEPTNVTKVVSSGTVGANVNRLTDTRLYTGSHKERFDEEGRGRGLEGREDIIDDSGYVQGFRSKDKVNDDNNKNKKT